MRLFFLFFLTVFSLGAWAQSEADLSPQWEVGLLAGKLLPSQVSGLEEIMSLGGVHLGYRLAPMVYTQGNIHLGNGEGQKWKSLSAGLRMDQPMADFLISGSAAIQSSLITGPKTKEKNVWGVVFGGSLMASIAGPAWLKMDMDFGFGPGTTLFLSLGLLARF
jgi:hypothetical protein